MGVLSPECEQMFVVLQKYSIREMSQQPRVALFQNFAHQSIMSAVDGLLKAPGYGEAGKTTMKREMCFKNGRDRFTE